MKTIVDVEELQKIYSNIYTGCPDDLWKKFCEEALDLVRDYQSSIGEKTVHQLLYDSKLSSNIHGEAMYLTLNLVSKTMIAKILQISKEELNTVLKENPPVPNTKHASIMRHKTPSYVTKKNTELTYAALLNDEKLMKNIYALFEEGSGISSISRELNVPINFLRRTLPARVSPQQIRFEGMQKLREHKETIIEAYHNNPDWSSTDLLSFSRRYCGNISEKTFAHFLKEEHCIISEERRNRARAKKSKNANNTSYQQRTKTVEKICELYGSVDDLTTLYCAGKAGTYSSIVKRLRENGVETSVRQVSRIITENEKYYVSKSISETIFVNDVVDLLGLTDDEYVREYKFSNDKQYRLDLFIPKYGVAFNFNGNYWHCDEVVRYNYGVDGETYHGKMQRLADSKGIKLCFVWEDDYNNNQENILKAISEHNFSSPLLNVLSKNVRKRHTAPRKKRAKNIIETLGIEYETIRQDSETVYDCGKFFVRDYSSSISNNVLFQQYASENKELITIYPWHNVEKVAEFLNYRIFATEKTIYARKCDVEVVAGCSKTVRRFIEKNHILGAANFSNIVATSLLKHNGELVGVSLFTSPKKGSDVVELKRLVFLRGVQVSGGASKMLKHAARSPLFSSFNTMFTFSDNDLGTGKVYSKLGFLLNVENSGNKVWYNFRNGQKFTNKTLYQVGADRLLRNIPGYSPFGITNSAPSNAEIVQMFGFIPIVDSGYRKWIIDLQHFH